ncbi:MAG: penicillin-binding protein 1C, partial [Dysgonamonadaceae bacterium]|nr:penicillin-binding protein 1C [Dysgonamonadaceae bacterium]
MRHIRKRNIIIPIAGIALSLYLFCLPRQLFDVPYSTVVSDRRNELLGARIAEDNQWRFPPSDTVPEKFGICLTEFEDRYFNYHWGINPLATGRALIQNIRAGHIVSGGSTITMQTIRLSRKNTRTFGEKIIEMILATRLEFRYSKEKILALYASHAPFGGNVVGLEAASWRYFGHSPKILSWAEAATLAVLPNTPAQIHLSRNRTILAEKRNKLLKRLKEKKIIDESTYQLALSEPLPSEPLPLPQVAPHLVSYFYQNNKGENCTSTIDKGLQLRIEQILSRWNDEFSRSDIRNIAAIIIDVEKNQVLAYCGNTRFEKSSSANQVDIIRAPRSTGSILKPFLYCVMLQEGNLLKNTLLPDVPININGFQPQNFNRSFDGAVHASDALTRSLNIPSVYELREYSVPKFYSFLKKAGFSTLNKPASHYGLSLILGGAEATLWDVAAAYNDMAKTLCAHTVNNKRYVTGKPEILLGKSGKNNVFLPIKDHKQTIYHPGAVWQTFDVLKEVNRPEEIDWKYITSMQTVAWKTGTSYGFRDAWAIGITPRYVVGVWVGNANGEGKAGLTGASTAGPVLFDLFNILPRSLHWFDIPYNSFIEATVCKESGHLAGKYCDHTDTLLICPEGLKTESCPYHIPVNVTENEHYRVYEYCAGSDGIKQINWFVLPPAWAWYYKQQNPSYRNLPPI